LKGVPGLSYEMASPPDQGAFGPTYQSSLVNITSHSQTHTHTQTSV
jgi:hypothetical protein